MLTEPQDDPHLRTLEKAIADAVAARLIAGPRPTPDADAIALRDLLRTLPVAQRAAVRAVMGRMEVGLSRPLCACGGVSQLLAADRWGPFARAVPDADQALQAARQGARALIDVGQKPWWGKLLGMPELRVIAALPDDAHARPRALLISGETTGPTGDDRTYWVTDSAMAEEAIVETLSRTGLAAGLLASAGGLKLFALNGYVQAEDERLNAAPGELRGVIGAAPVF